MTVLETRHIRPSEFFTESLDVWCVRHRTKGRFTIGGFKFWGKDLILNLIEEVKNPGSLNFYTQLLRYVDAYTTEDLVFHWRTDAKAVELNKDISLPEYDLKGVSQIVCSQKINSTGLSIYFT